jgi:hypothetical protein
MKLVVGEDRAPALVRVLAGERKHAQHSDEQKRGDLPPTERCWIRCPDAIVLPSGDAGGQRLEQGGAGYQ